MPEPAQTDGAAEHVRAAADWAAWPPLVVILVLSVVSLSPLPLALLALLPARVAWVAAAPLAGAPPRWGLRRLTRLLVPLAVAAALAPALAVGLLEWTWRDPRTLDLLHVAVGAWLALSLLSGVHAGSLTRPGSAPRRGLWRAAGRSAAAVGLIAAFELLPLNADLRPLLSLLVALLSPGLSPNTLGPFRAAPQLVPGYAASLAAALERELGWPAAPIPAGVEAERDLPEGRLRLRIDLQRIPALTEIELPLPQRPALAALRIRARRRGEEGGADLGDPLLQGALCVEGLAPAAARALLAGLHEPLLAIFHAYPDATLREGRLWVPIDGPPFAPGQSEIEAARHLAERIAACRALSAALRGAADPRRPAAQARRERVPEG